MKQLSGLDAAFLTLETHNTTGHIGGLCILDPSESPTPLDLAALTRLMSERAPLIPQLRQRLKYVPLGLDQPYWTDDVNFDVEFHVREISLPTPGSTRNSPSRSAGCTHARSTDGGRCGRCTSSPGWRAGRGVHQDAPRPPSTAFRVMN